MLLCSASRVEKDSFYDKLDTILSTIKGEVCTNLGFQLVLALGKEKLIVSSNGIGFMVMDSPEEIWCRLIDIAKSFHKGMELELNLIKSLQRKLR